MDSRIILKRLDRIEELPTLPKIAFQVNKMLMSYDTSIKNLTQIIEKDQSITSKLLKLSNSSFYGLRRKISNISEAIVLLGFNTVRNGIVSISVIKAFSGKNTVDGFNISNFWKHSFAVATVSKYLSEKMIYKSPEDCFLSGLLHDIGKVILSQYFQDYLDKVLASVSKDTISFYEAERKETTTDHAWIGGYVAEKWQLPEDLVDAIRYHHIIKNDAENYKLLTIVHTADLIVNNFEYDSDGKLNTYSFHPDILELLGPQIESVKNEFSQISDDIDAACDFFMN